MRQQTYLRAGQYASAARSVLSCPRTMELAVSGIVVGDPEIRHGIDHGGVPVLTTSSQSELLRAARESRVAILRVTSAVAGFEGAGLSVVGTLGVRGADCCADSPRTVVELVPLRVLLALPVESGEACDESRFEYEVPLSNFQHPMHELNPGYLQASREHANGAHGEDLRRSIATARGVETRGVLAVTIVELTCEHALVDWIDGEGARRMMVSFAETATSREHLSSLLRNALQGSGESRQT